MNKENEYSELDAQIENETGKTSEDIELEKLQQEYNNIVKFKKQMLGDKTSHMVSSGDEIKNAFQDVPLNPSFEFVDKCRKNPVKEGLLKVKVNHRIIDFSKIDRFINLNITPSRLSGLIWYGQSYQLRMNKTAKPQGQINMAGLMALITIIMVVGIVGFAVFKGIS